MKKKSKDCKKLLKDDLGFTLVELMLVLLITSFIMAALYMAHRTQQRSQTAQDQIVEMQQNLRSGFNFIQREVRMAGFDPQGNSGAGITVATNSGFEFTQDTNDNGVGAYPGDDDVADVGETITYDLGGDADNDGIVDVGISSLTRDTDGAGGGPPQPLADNIEAIEFLYLIGDDLTPTLNPAAGQIESIRGIVVSILARASNLDPDFNGGPAYLPASQDPNYQNGDYFVAAGFPWGNNDNFRRRLLIATIQLRNMGL